MESLEKSSWSDAGIDRVDAVVHLGTFTPKSPEHASEIAPVFDGNLIGTRRLLETGPKPHNLVFASTVDVYQRSTTGQPLTELSPIGPAGLYGASKYFGERLVNVWAAGSGVKLAILRLGHIFSPGEEAYEKFIPTAIRNILSGAPARLVGGGAAQRDLLYVDDVV